MLSLQIALRIFGLIATALLLEREWTVPSLWGIWVVFGILPAILDGISFFVLYMQERSLKQAVENNPRK